jgi:hypothetical protein
MEMRAKILALLAELAFAAVGDGCAAVATAIRIG